MSEPKFKRGDIVTSGNSTFIVVGVVSEPVTFTYDESLVNPLSPLYSSRKNPLVAERFYQIIAVWDQPICWRGPVAESELTKVGEAVIEE